MWPRNRNHKDNMKKSEMMKSSQMYKTELHFICTVVGGTSLSDMYMNRQKKKPRGGRKGKKHGIENEEEERVERRRG